MDALAPPPISHTLDPLDRLIQEEAPVLAMPRYGALPPLRTGRHRFLLGADGLWIEARPPWGHLCVPLWWRTRATPLPYGGLRPGLIVVPGPIPWELLRQALRQAGAQAAQDREWAAWIVWSAEAGYRLLDLPQEATSVSCRLPARPALGPGTSLVLDVHSHGRLPAGFSRTDDEDDRGGVKFALVAGDWKPDARPPWRLALRLCVEGFFFPLRLRRLFAAPPPPATP